MDTNSPNVKLAFPFRYVIGSAIFCFVFGSFAYLLFCYPCPTVFLASTIGVGTVAVVRGSANGNHLRQLHRDHEAVATGLEVDEKTVRERCLKTIEYFDNAFNRAFKARMRKLEREGLFKRDSHEFFARCDAEKATDHLLNSYRLASDTLRKLDQRRRATERGTNRQDRNWHKSQFQAMTGNSTPLNIPEAAVARRELVSGVQASEVQAIRVFETQYTDVLFRSKTEARWAVWLDAIKAHWVYEKEGFPLAVAGYEPDFWLTSNTNHEQGCWLEVKGRTPIAEELCKAEQLAIHTSQRVVIVTEAPTYDNRIWQWDARGNLIHDGTTEDQCGVLHSLVVDFHRTNGSVDDAWQIARRNARSARYDHELKRLVVPN